MAIWKQIGRWFLLSFTILVGAACTSTAEPEPAAEIAAVPTAATEAEVPTAVSDTENNTDTAETNTDTDTVEVTPVPTEQPLPEATATSWLLEQLPSQGEAPEITNEVWINSEPLTLEDLRGQVVLLEFWTYG